MYNIGSKDYDGDFQTLFESIINYGIIAWGGAYVNAMETLSTRLTRLIKKIKVQSSGVLINLLW